MKGMRIVLVWVMLALTVGLAVLEAVAQQPEHEELSVSAGETFEIRYYPASGDFVIFNGPIRMVGTEKESLFKDYYIFEALGPGEAQVVVYRTDGSSSSSSVSVKVTVQDIYDVHIS